MNLDRIHAVAKLIFAIFSSDLDRRFRPTFLGLFWYVIPLLTAIALAGAPGSLTANGSGILNFVQITLYICILQFLTDIGFESARLARRNRALLPMLGANTLIFNLAGALSATVQFISKVLLFCVLLSMSSSGREAISGTLVRFSFILVPFFLAGLALSFLITYPSLLFLDLRYSAQFLPLLLTIASPTANSLAISSSVEALLSPVSLISIVTTSHSALIPDWVIGAIAIQSTIWILLCLGFSWLQRRVASIVVTSYL
jgi:ABC-type polysaccharide/polyol phosphate export permease